VANPVFVPEQFVGHPWYVGRTYDSPERDARFCNQFARFLASGCAWSAFPRWFYQELSNTFGHIAHFNQCGFYETWFETTAQRVAFLEYTLTAEFIVMAREEAILAWLPTTSYLNTWRGQLAAETRTRDLAELVRLATTYGVTITVPLASPADDAAAKSVVGSLGSLGSRGRSLMTGEDLAPAMVEPARRPVARTQRAAAPSAWVTGPLWNDGEMAEETEERQESRGTSAADGAE